MNSIVETTMRPLTTDDYIIAAKIVASCPKDRLAIVTSLLISGGFEVNYSRKLVGGVGSGRLDAAAVVSRLRDFKEQHDLTWRQLSEQLGIPADVLRTYVSGRRIPSQDRCDEMLCKLYNLTGGFAEEVEEGDQEE